jgi:hypothetical protein
MIFALQKRTASDQSTAFIDSHNTSGGWASPPSSPNKPRRRKSLSSEFQAMHNYNKSLQLIHRDHVTILKLLLHSIPKEIKMPKKTISYQLNNLHLVEKITAIENILYEKIGKVFISNYQFSVSTPGPSSSLQEGGGLSRSNSSLAYSASASSNNLKPSMKSLLDIGNIMKHLIHTNENAQFFVKEFMKSSMNWESLMKNISSSRFKIGIR